LVADALGEALGLVVAVDVAFDCDEQALRRISMPTIQPMNA
jgi:hypothetical protein